MFKDQLHKFHELGDHTYLNNAYMSPLLKSVEEAGISGIAKKRNPATITPDEFFKDTEILRGCIAELLDTNEQDRIVTIPSVSYGMANVVNNLRLQKGDNIVLAGEQFPSNYYPWKKTCDQYEGELTVIEAPEGFDGRGRKWNERLLEAITDQTRAVAIGHIHWADGTKFDLKSIRARTKEVGAILVIDGTQSIGALPFSINDIQPDALICAGYKWLFGPYSMGFAYYGEYFDQGSPIEENWINRKESENFAGLVNYKDDYQPMSLRYEVGEHSNFILVPMFLEGIKQVMDWNPQRIQDYCASITTPIISQLDKEFFFVEEPDFRASHLFGVRFKQTMDIDKLKQDFAKENIVLSIRGEAIRISTHIYNVQEDLQKLVTLLSKHQPVRA